MRVRRDRVMAGAALLGALTACSRAADAPPADRTVAVINAAPATPRPAATPTPIVVATLAPAPPHPTATSIAMRPRKDFVDPPLPPELRDDGGLNPLPPPPGNRQ